MAAIKWGVLAFRSEIMAVDYPFLIRVEKGNISSATRLQCAKLSVSGADNSGWLERELGD